MASRLPAAPPVLSGFQYVRPLGTGGFADVFLFEQHMPRRPVAVKVLLTDIIDEALLRMFTAEADAMARLSAHPSILTIYEASISADGRPYLVMEYCPSSFTSRYRQETIELEEVLSLGVTMGSAIETAHRAGLLHRDIKPSNILVTRYGLPVLSDFGIATAVGPGAAGDDVIAMSVPWSAPEIIAERSTGTVASEVWSLGATLYTLLAGVSPFEKPGRGMNQRELLKKRIAKASYTPTGRQDVTPELENILRTAMAKQPEHRHESILQLVTELQEIQQSLGFQVTPLEIAEDPWQPERSPGEEPQFVARQPRSQVQYDSQRASEPTKRSRKHLRERASDMGVPGQEEAGRSYSSRQLALFVGGTVIVTAVVVSGLVSLLGGL
ncbi:serine/threonine-protein kinase [Leucobacter chinensis]|uniref:serine/threonine-protein kinase n=1 Tax=Leucobacter chinensis TaxID=2851010 RepID=UPI001C23F31F|nr:serine/threonine-protein kinase [Leucobacter chinensis]